MHGRAGLLVVLILLQACQAPRRAEQAPVVEFPEVGVDDPAAYEGYTTRFFRDAAENTFQIYLNQRDGRVVHVWADAANESAAFTVRDTEGHPAPVVWGGSGAVAASEGRDRIMRYRLTADVGALEIGWFLLGTMRQERDFQGIEWHRRPWGDPPFILPELTDLIASLGRLPAEEQTQHLALLDASGVAELRIPARAASHALRRRRRLERARRAYQFRRPQPHDTRASRRGGHLDGNARGEPGFGARR
jgi:hypothetical protein